MEISKELSDLKGEIDVTESIRREIEELNEFLGVAKEEDKELLAGIEERLNILKRKLKDLSLETYLAGKYDEGDAILQIFAGAGGREAQDWAAILKRMYNRYCQKKGFQVRILDQSFGEAGGPEGRIGIKSMTMEILGKYAFGYLKKEAGVHRLVRISPFSAKKLRHTSFAQVVVFPKLKNIRNIDVNIKESDLEFETFRSSGPGGQYMQKTESAVRVIHLPTGVRASCQAGRSQGHNKKKALEILYSKLCQREEEKQNKDLQKIKGEIDPAWGKQIRNYVFHPYQVIKDLRTNVEASNVEAVMNGQLDVFIDKEIKYQEK